MRNRPALVISVLALFVALGGTGYAAFTLPRNSVGAKQLKRNAVTTPKIKNGAVTTGKLKNGAVTGSKMNFRGVIVPQAANASFATTAGSATSATNATNAGHASSADSAASATTATNAGTAATANSLPALTWTNLTLDSGWTVDAGSFATPSFTKDHEGFVHLRGAVDGLGASSGIATLPAGFAPSHDAVINALSINNAGNQVLMGLHISPTGQISTFIVGATGADQKFVSLDGISFFAG